MSNDEDVGGLRLVGACLGVSALLVSDRVTCLCLVGKASGSLLHWRRTCRWSMTSPRRRMDDINDVVDVGVDLMMNAILPCRGVLVGVGVDGSLPRGGSCRHRCRRRRASTGSV
jgi:hypothetical protein